MLPVWCKSGHTIVLWSNVDGSSGHLAPKSRPFVIRSTNIYDFLLCAENSSTLWEVRDVQDTLCREESSKFHISLYLCVLFLPCPIYQGKGSVLVIILITSQSLAVYIRDRANELILYKMNV